MHNQRQKKVLALGSMMFPIPRCTESRLQLLASRGTWPKWLCLNTRGKSWACYTWWLGPDRAWDEHETGQRCQPSVVRGTVTAELWEADNARESGLCHNFARQLSESTLKPFIQHLIKAPLKGWTESTACTALWPREQTGAVQGAMEMDTAQKNPRRMDSLKAGQTRA